MCEELLTKLFLGQSLTMVKSVLSLQEIFMAYSKGKGNFPSTLQLYS